MASEREKRTLVAARALLLWQDELDAAIDAAAACDALERAPLGVKDHGFARRIKLELDPFDVGPFRGEVHRNPKPVAEQGGRGSVVCRKSRYEDSQLTLSTRGRDGDLWRPV